jgi:pyruvate/2-oxoglutarate dehydrogenase complex dihydrolipoamide dehydrogenase (E3) component
MGVDVFLGEGRFSGPDTVAVGDRTLRFKNAVIATGARAVRPEVPGLDEAGFLTNETVFSLTECPPRLAVFGAGPLGCELAQAFHRLGSRVVIVEKGDHLLPNEDPDAAAALAASFGRDGIKVRQFTECTRVTVSKGAKVVHLECGSDAHDMQVDEILVGAGRAPNVEGLNLADVGVEYDEGKGVTVDDHLRTTNPRVFAAGDVCLRYRFTHTADAAARIVIQNALFWGRRRVSALTVPWCTYTDPEIAHVGMSEWVALDHGFEVDTFMERFDEVDRAIADGEEDGFVKIHVRRTTDRIVGATIVARHAGEMINELTLAIAAKKGMRDLARVIHPYPTQADAIKRAADAYNRARLTPFWRSLLERFMVWRR